MTSGLPDYHSLVRPKYGGGRITWGHDTVKKNDRTSILTVAGRGMIYGGIVFLEGAPGQNLSAPELKVDGSFISDAALDYMSKLGLIQPGSMPLYLLVYDTTNGIYCVAATYGITFESGFEITYLEQAGGTPLVVAGISYALI